MAAMPAAVQLVSRLQGATWHHWLCHSCFQALRSIPVPEEQVYPASTPSRAASCCPKYRTVGLKDRPYR